MDYLRRHPEIAEESLRKIGLNVEEIDKLLLEGWTIQINLNNFKDATFKKVKKGA
jgi:hypothetical protein